MMAITACRVPTFYTLETFTPMAAMAISMPPPTTSTVDPSIAAALELLDRRKEELCAVLESNQATSDQKFEALVALAYMTGVLTRVAAESST